MKMHWLLLAVFTASFYALYNVFIKIASGHIHGVAGAVILQVVAAALGGLLLAWLWWRGVSFEMTAPGLRWAVLAGVFVGLAEITSFFVFARGIPAATGIAVIIGGSVVFGALIGHFFLREALDLRHLIGILMVVGGIWLLAK